MPSTLNLKGGAEICQEGGRDAENVCMYKEHDMCDQSVPGASEIINMHMYHLFLPNLSLTAVVLSLGHTLESPKEHFILIP